jgi:cell division protein ZapA (FtsZ GTPase activity inhibitor)
MGNETELVVFSVCGQEFRIRSTREDAPRTRRIAADMCERVRQQKERTGVNDVRAVLMACYELAYELDERSEVLAKLRAHDKTIDSAKEVMDRLLCRLEEELAAPAPDAKAAKKRKPGAQQLDLAAGLGEEAEQG